MTVQQRLYDVQDLWQLYCQPGMDQKRFELIDGELFEMSGRGGVHGRIAIRLGRYLYSFAEENALGIITAGTGYHKSGDRFTLLLPDIAFISYARAPVPFPEKFVPVMPDLAVEIRSPSNSLADLRHKAGVYLRQGTQLVWIVLPAQASVEIHRPQSAAETLGLGDALSGEDILPGFALDISLLFP